MKNRYNKMCQIKSFFFNYWLGIVFYKEKKSLSVKNVFPSFKEGIFDISQEELRYIRYSWNKIYGSLMQCIKYTNKKEVKVCFIVAKACCCHKSLFFCL